MVEECTDVFIFYVIKLCEMELNYIFTVWHILIHVLCVSHILVNNLQLFSELCNATVYFYELEIINILTNI